MLRAPAFRCIGSSLRRRCRLSANFAVSTDRNGAAYEHKSVLLGEVLTHWRHPSTDEPSASPRVYVDCTLGMGGHTIELLQRDVDAVVIGIDRDRNAIAVAKNNLAKNGIDSDRLYTHHGGFADVGAAVASYANAKAHCGVKISGILADLGLSSMQLAMPERGFSFRFVESPLDMRFDGPLDRTLGELSAASNEGRERTAAQILKEESQRELERIFADYGEEAHARLAAKLIVRTLELWMCHACQR